MYFNLKHLFSSVFSIASEREKGHEYAVFCQPSGSRDTSLPVVIHSAEQFGVSQFCELFDLSNISTVPACLLT